MSDTPLVCHIPPVVPTNTQPGPNNLPSIPPAVPTIASLTDTVNRMRQVIMILTGQQGTQGPRGPAGKDNNAKAKWSEVSRTVETVKIHNPNDKSQFIEVERINKLVMGDSSTGQTWTWTH